MLMWLAVDHGPTPTNRWALHTHRHRTQLTTANMSQSSFWRTLLICNEKCKQTLVLMHSIILWIQGRSHCLTHPTICTNSGSPALQHCTAHGHACMLLRCWNGGIRLLQLLVALPGNPYVLTAHCTQHFQRIVHKHTFLHTSACTQLYCAHSWYEMWYL